MKELYIGLMSGTSADGIDAALVDFSDKKPTVVATLYAPYSDQMRKDILELCVTGTEEILRLGTLDVQLARAFAETVNTLLEKHQIDHKDIRAIGSHGQTIRHMPYHHTPFTLQIGDPNTIAAKTGITTIADFRRKDLAYGGQGAPLVPAFHQQLFSSPLVDRAIVNIGGISNVTLLPKEGHHVIGFDTGPGNTLLDAWIFKHKKKHHDADGHWGKSGEINDALLQSMLADPYFQLPPPKSTGREYFNLAWLQKHLDHFKLSPEDVQATLTELTAITVFNGINERLSQGEIIICGGGAHNQFLVERLTVAAHPHFAVTDSSAHGINPDWIEAVAFAWLAKQTLNKQPGNLPSVTGATVAAILGGVYHV